MTLMHGPDGGPVTREMDRADANRIWGAILPTYRTPAAARLRDAFPLIRALRNPRAVELVAARLDNLRQLVELPEGPGIDPLAPRKGVRR